MNHYGMRILPALAALALVTSSLQAEPEYVASASGDTAAAADTAGFSQAELDQMLAPIALHPDPLLAQILIASTYPLEIVEAARWSRRNPQLAGEDAVAVVADRDWDPSVKALVAFPDILARMDEDLDWTRNLGDAMLFQEAQVMDSVQFLRARADAAGSLEQSEHVRVIREQETIIIEPVQTRVVHVPYYDTRVVYGHWWRPAYPPLYWGPPSYYYPTYSGFYWSTGVHLSPGFFLSSFYWPQSSVIIVNRPRYHYAPRYRPHPARPYYLPGQRWKHNPAHRRGVHYRHAEVRQRYQPYVPAPSARLRVPTRGYSRNERNDRNGRAWDRNNRLSERRAPAAGNAAARAPELRREQQAVRIPREHRPDLPRYSGNREASRLERQLSAGNRGRNERATVNPPANRNLPATAAGSSRRAIQPNRSAQTNQSAQANRPSALPNRPAQTGRPAQAQRQSRAAPPTASVPERRGKAQSKKQPRNSNQRDARQSMR